MLCRSASIEHNRTMIINHRPVVLTGCLQRHDFKFKSLQEAVTIGYFGARKRNPVPVK